MLKICYDRMFKLMADKNISPKKLLTKKIIGYGVLIKLINNSDNVQMRSLIRISQFLGCDIEDLFEYTDYKES